MKIELKYIKDLTFEDFLSIKQKNVICYILLDEVKELEKVDDIECFFPTTQKTKIEGNYFSMTKNGSVLTASPDDIVYLIDEEAPVVSEEL